MFGQILRYMGWIHTNCRGDGAHNVRGVILASRFPETARYSRIGLLKDDAEQHLKFHRHRMPVRGGLTQCSTGIPKAAHWPAAYVDRILCEDARDVLKRLPEESVALSVTSPPYWNVVDYGVEGQIGQTSYEDYLEELGEVWRETARVLIPNGKLAIVTPVMPIPKSQIGDQHTRHLKNIASDIEASILRDVPGLHRFSLFVWKKQTTTKMFGSYPFPPNIYEDNTIEFVNVYVKDGPPPQIPKTAKEPSRLTQQEWLNLSMQIWPMYPEDVKRTGGHPAPFPTVLPSAPDS